MKRLYEQFSEFLHTFDIVPVLVVVSVYEYWQALALVSIPWIVAVPLAIGVDLTHFRTTRTAVRQGGWWVIGAFLSFAIAFGLQYAFYAPQLGDGWLAVAYSAVVPVPITLLAIAYEQGELGKDTLEAERLQATLSANESLLNEFERKVNGLESKLNATENALNDSELLVNEIESELKEKTERLNGSIRLLNEAYADIEHKDADIEHLAVVVEQQRPLVESVTHVNEFGQELIKYMAGKSERSQKELAQLGGVSAGTVNGLINKLNGVSK